MQWILENWMLLLVGGGMVAMHLFGHRHKGRGHASQSGSVKRAEARGPEVSDRAEGGTDG